jgi:hypothetical protein
MPKELSDEARASVERGLEQARKGELIRADPHCPECMMLRGRLFVLKTEIEQLTEGEPRSAITDRIDNLLEEYWPNGYSGLPGEGDRGIVWEGDLDDDCTARWEGLMLRAEAMSEDKDGHGENWWWAVYDNEGKKGSSEIAVCPLFTDTGRQARRAAERAAKAVVRARKTTGDDDV